MQLCVEGFAQQKGLAHTVHMPQGILLFGGPANNCTRKGLCQSLLQHAFQVIGGGARASSTLKWSPPLTHPPTMTLPSMTGAPSQPRRCSGWPSAGLSLLHLVPQAGMCPLWFQSASFCIFPTAGPGVRNYFSVCFLNRWHLWCFLKKKIQLFSNPSSMDGQRAGHPSDPLQRII